MTIKYMDYGMKA